MEEPEEFTDLKAAIRGARMRAGLTQVEAAKRADMSERGWQDWEKGKTNPIMRIHDIEDALGLTRGHFTAQLTVLERLLTFEQDLYTIEKRLDEVLEQQRGIHALLKLLVTGDT